MKFLDARRLTGPSLLFDKPAAILDVQCTRNEANRLAQTWRTKVERMLEALSWAPVEFARNDLVGGVSLAFTAPIDALYTASEINEWAWATSEAEINSTDAPDFNATVDVLRASQAEEANIGLLELERLARDKTVSFLWDDDEVSLGLGRSARSWPSRDLPDSADLDWQSFSDVPIGLVTGTNGKTTTVRLATHILRHAGLNVGLSSTDWIAVNDNILDRGDWSGPGGARAVLRQNDVDVAILESARGGLLRRGLGVHKADAALITNIAEDHLGDFGSQNLHELLAIKWIVSRPVRNSGRLILNADDKLLVEKSSEYRGELVWFSLSDSNNVIRKHTSLGGLAFVVDNDDVLKLDGNARELICRDDEMPISLGGAARHNVANALAAAALTWCLSAPLTSIRDGLKSMSQDDNPGRCNVYDVQGRKVLIDFAHNPHAMHALFDMAQALPARRRVLCFGQAGDRPDDLIREMTHDAWTIGLDRVVVSELAQYHRGREHGDVYAVIRDELLKLGATSTQIEHHEEETESLSAAMSWASEGDLIIMLALGGSAPILEKLASLDA